MSTSILEDYLCMECNITSVFFQYLSILLDMNMQERFVLSMSCMCLRTAVLRLVKVCPTALRVYVREAA
jgi:hypothetical protein